MSLTDRLLGRCTFPAPGTPLVCGVSGGADSLALLVLAVASGCRVTAVHVDHGLRNGTTAEADTVADAARRFGADFRLQRVEVGEGSNLEARAREARHRALGPDAATGHTADDQAETVLINLLRGAGVHGLAGMRSGPTASAPRGEAGRDGGPLRRPRTGTGLDPTNIDPRFVRNRARHRTGAPVFRHRRT